MHDVGPAPSHVRKVRGARLPEADGDVAAALGRNRDLHAAGQALNALVDEYSYCNASSRGCASARGDEGEVGVGAGDSQGAVSPAAIDDDEPRAALAKRLQRCERVRQVFGLVEHRDDDAQFRLDSLNLRRRRRSPRLDRVRRIGLASGQPLRQA